MSKNLNIVRKTSSILVYSSFLGVTMRFMRREDQNFRG